MNPEKVVFGFFIVLALTLNPSLAESTAPPPPNPGFPQQWRERFKPGQILSGGRSRVVP